MDISVALDELSKSIGINAANNNKTHDVTSDYVPPLYEIKQHNRSCWGRLHLHFQDGVPPDMWERLDTRKPHPLVKLFIDGASPSLVNHHRAFIMNKSGHILVDVTRAFEISWCEVAKKCFKVDSVSCRETVYGMLLFGPIDVLWVPFYSLFS